MKGASLLFSHVPNPLQPPGGRTERKTGLPSTRCPFDDGIRHWHRDANRPPTTPPSCLISRTTRASPQSAGSSGPAPWRSSGDHEYRWSTARNARHHGRYALRSQRLQELDKIRLLPVAQREPEHVRVVRDHLAQILEAAVVIKTALLADEKAPQRSRSVELLIG
jgi:hypothetical protein